MCVSVNVRVNVRVNVCECGRECTTLLDYRSLEELKSLIIIKEKGLKDGNKSVSISGR